jgi:hypothetical protein
VDETLIPQHNVHLIGGAAGRTSMERLTCWRSNLDAAFDDFQNSMRMVPCGGFLIVSSDDIVDEWQLQV